MLFYTVFLLQQFRLNREAQKAAQALGLNEDRTCCNLIEVCAYLARLECLHARLVWHRRGPTSSLMRRSYG
jgi:hypothetical protein